MLMIGSQAREGRGGGRRAQAGGAQGDGTVRFWVNGEYLIAL